MLFSPVSSATARTQALRLVLMESLVHAHRPELADVVASAELSLDFPGVWLQPVDASLGIHWLENKLWDAAVEEGVPVAWIRVLPGGFGGAT